MSDERVATLLACLQDAKKHIAKQSEVISDMLEKIASQDATIRKMRNLPESARSQYAVDRIKNLCKELGISYNFITERNRNGGILKSPNHVSDRECVILAARQTIRANEQRQGRSKLSLPEIVKGLGFDVSHSGILHAEHRAYGRMLQCGWTEGEPITRELAIKYAKRPRGKDGNR